MLRTVPDREKSENDIFLSSLCLTIIILHFFAFYLMSKSEPYWEWTRSNCWRLALYGQRITKSSVYIEWLMIVLQSIQPNHYDNILPRLTPSHTLKGADTQLYHFTYTVWWAYQKTDFTHSDLGTCLLCNMWNNFSWFTGSKTSEESIKHIQIVECCLLYKSFILHEMIGK